MNSRKNISWIVILSLMGSILLSSCTGNKPSEEKAKAAVDAEVLNKITAINPSKIHIDSGGRIITNNISYEEMRELAEVLTQLGDSGQIRFSREYEEVKDNRGRTISKSENGYITTYEYPKNPYIPFSSSSKTIKEK